MSEANGSNPVRKKFTPSPAESVPATTPEPSSSPPKKSPQNRMDRSFGEPTGSQRWRLRHHGVYLCTPVRTDAGDLGNGRSIHARWRSSTRVSDGDNLVLGVHQNSSFSNIAWRVAVSSGRRFLRPTCVDDFRGTQLI